ncbi:MAG TPA: lysozyme inhibitor LprI family protein [Allosphingosinicella sp.]|nr:lysozyme inhibitor LprI family protein [Allosphingosinicella sp.]
MRLWWLLLALTLTPWTAKAASFDCGKASTLVERQICADPKLSAADVRLAGLYQRALAVTPRQADVRLEQRRWLTERKPGAYLAAEYADRAGELQGLIDQAARVRRDMPADLAHGCIPVADPGDFKICQVLNSGRLNTGAGGPILWQIQALDPLGAGVSAAEAIVLLKPAGPGRAVPVIWKIEEQTTLLPPELVKSSFGLLLVLPGTEQAQAVENMESVFRYATSGWVELDTTSWKDSFSSRLPDHRLGLGEGVTIDYASFTASTPLWRPGEPSHFPTGGAAKIRFKLVGDTLAVDTVEARLGKAAALRETGQ